MSYLSFFHLFSDFLLKNRAKFDTFSLIFEFQPPLLIRFSDTEIPIVLCLLLVLFITTLQMHKHGWATRTGAHPNIYGFTTSRRRLYKKMQNVRKTRQSFSMSTDMLVCI